MNYLSGALRYVAGGETDSRDAVPLLIDRIKTSALPQDRRAAIAALTEATKLSPPRQVFVGEVAIKVIYAVLEQDKDYDDTLKATLELLIALCGTLDPPDTKDLLALLGDVAQGLSDQEQLKVFEEKSARAAATNVDMFLGMPKSVSLLLELLEKTDFYVKFSTIELLTAMAANSRQTLQMAVLEAPQGVSRICDLLDDNHRLLRSNAVLLLSTLCDESPEICKIVAYGGVLEKLFTLVEAVAGSSGDRVTAYGDDDDDDDDDNLEAAIVVQDVMYVLRNLVRGASTTRTFFRDTGCLPRLVNVIKRATVDANMLGEQAPTSSGRTSAIEKQARKNLIIAMHCINGLAKDGDSESRLVKNDFAATNLFNILAGLAYSHSAIAPSAKGKLPENLLQVRVAALKTMATLARGHDDFRSMFSSSTFSVGRDGNATSVQVAALHAMLGDPSSAVRVAAYSALRESFVVDAGLDLPSSNLLIAMTSSGGSAAYSVGDRTTGLRRNSMSSNDLPSPSNAVRFIAESLKAALVDWPRSTDAAGVFYAASLVTWVVDRVEGARERLLAAYVNGSSLLPQVIRILGKLEREKGPPEVRIALFSLTCTWLHGSPSAVSAFLSSAMHLPMLVDVLNGTGSRGDVAEVHVRGLSAVLLGICLQATDSAQDAANDGGFLSGGGGPSMVIPRGTVADVIRNRIGVTVFTACLDDLRASKAFSSEELGGNMWVFAEELIAVESRTGFLSGTGSLGHEQWYSAEVISVVNDVYKNVGTKALDLIAEQPQVPMTVGNGVASNLTMNGHASDADPVAGTQRTLLADSARDEVLHSYKEFIRSQDESLNAARRQIEELATALRETQRELDAKANEASVAKESDVARDVQKENERLVAQKEALEALLEEKASDFAALSDAYAALEEDHNNMGSAVSAEGTASVTAEISSLRSQNAHIRDSLNAEIARSRELAHRATLLDSNVKAKDAEVEAVARERDMLRSNAHPEVAEALQWRTRAELAEASLTSRQSVLDSVQAANTSLEDRLQDIERSRDESAYSVSALEKKLESAQLELEDLRSTRRRELQVARESSHTATAAAQKEIAVLKQQLTEASQARSEVQLSENSEPASEELKNFEGLKRDHQSLIAAFEQMKTELLDAKSAVSQWQKRADTAEASREREALENNRLSNVARALETQVRKVNDNFGSQAQVSSARILELEQQNAELDEMRRRAGEETRLLKEELATRTEQSIRLSGQLYETEESKTKVEEELQGLQEQISDTKARLEPEKHDFFHEIGVEKQDQENLDGLQMKIVALETELEALKDALADAKDRESLSEAHAREREAAVAKAAALEQGLVRAQAAEAKLMADVDELKQRLLSLDEAEEAKRALTMQVVSLQQSLAEVSPINQGTPWSANAKLLESVDKVKQLQTIVAEKDMRLNGLESSLTAALDRTDTVEKDKVDLTKQVAEAEAMLSVLNSERDDLSAKCNELQSELEAKPPFSDLDSSVVRELEDKLRESETKRAAVSNELTSLVDACRQAEQESREMRNECETLRKESAMCEKELQKLQEENAKLCHSHEIERIVNSTVLEIAVQACSDVNSDALNIVRHERDIALSLQSQQLSEIDCLKTEKDCLKVSLKERDVSLAAVSGQGAQLTQLTAKLAALESAAEERDELAIAIEVSNAAVREMTKERDSLQNRLQQQSLSVITAENTNDSSHSSQVSSEAPTSPTYKRVAELEDALRDAARTVSATNLELISAQALLVELSADKTAIRTELAAAQEQIQQLNAQLSIEPRAHPNESALSEVSEQEQFLAELPADSSNSHSGQEVTEQSLKAAHSEVENLRTILKRSISEADSAVSLLTTIDLKVGQVERKLHDSRSSLDDSMALEKKLGDEVETLKQSYASEKKALVTEINAVKSELSNLELAREKESKELTENVKSLELSGKREREKLQSVLLEKEDLIGNLHEESASLKSQLQDASEKVERFLERANVLEAVNSKYSSTILALEGTVSSANKALDENATREKELQGSLQKSREELRRMHEVFDVERQALEAKQKKEVEDLEAELDRASQSMEDTERKFRNAEASLKNTVGVLEGAVKSTRKEVDSAERKWKSTSAQLAAVTTEKQDVEDVLTATVREKEIAISSLAKGRDEALLLVERRTNERDAMEKDLVDSRGLLEKTKADLKDEREHTVMLEGENQDFLSSIESLETSSKRLRDELTKTKNELASVIQTLEISDENLRQQTDEVKQLAKQLKSVENEVKQLRATQTNLQDGADRLRVSLESAEAAREAAEQDNSDLKAWVGDLERQATDLQSAAENFEEVEQSLREALEAQRHVAEQNVELAEELKKERELVASTEAQLRGAIRDSNEAESARVSSQRRTSALEARIREIREEHLMRFSNSEDAIKAKAQRCAELETKLASAERQLAELATVSDSLFEARAELGQRVDDIKNLQERAESSELRAEDLQTKVQTMESEMVEMRESATGDAYRTLEAEHNDLLVCLADLELECTTLKEELGRE